MVRKSEVFVEYEPPSEMPLSWARALAADLRRGGRYRTVKVSKSRAGEGAVSMGRVWVDQSSVLHTGRTGRTGEASAWPVAAVSGTGKESTNGEVA